MGDFDAAERADFLVDTGEQLHRAGRAREAESYYQQALELDPGHPGALYFLANIAFADGRLAFAAELVRELLNQEPTDSEAWHLRGMIAFREGNLRESIECYKKAIAFQPTYAMAFYSLGIALETEGDTVGALESLVMAVKTHSQFSEAHYAIGKIYKSQLKLDDAIVSFRQAIAIKPDLIPAYEELAQLLFAQKKIDEVIELLDNALARNVANAGIHAWLGTAHALKMQLDAAIYHCEKALLFDPDCFVAHFSLGTALRNKGNVREAIARYKRAHALNSNDPQLLAALASTLYSIGELNEAAEIYQGWLKIEPENPVARHHLAACTGSAVPLRADDAYVESTFDAFADSFDTVLGDVNYEAPQRIAEMVRVECGEARKQFEILDAGCGTGLCGPLVMDYASRLVGVDLSAGMLEKARQRGGYDELIKAEITSFMQSRGAAFDLILSADTLIYFGALEELLAASRKALRANGYLFVTVEVLGESDGYLGYRLNPHGRYSHQESYVRKVLSQCGFVDIKTKPIILRNEHGHPVDGLTVSCRVI
ncbi:MAG: tetratricopeptide repeat protein [Spongiibacteraceae bacterium]